MLIYICPQLNMLLPKVVSNVFIYCYFMIDTFSFVIQQPLFNLQPWWILTNWKSGEGLIM